MQQLNSNSCEIIKEIIKLCSPEIDIPSITEGQLQKLKVPALKSMTYLFCYTWTLKAPDDQKKPSLIAFLCESYIKCQTIQAEFKLPQRASPEIAQLYSVLSAKFGKVMPVQQQKQKINVDEIVQWPQSFLFQNLMVLGLFKVTAKDFQFSFDFDQKITGQQLKLIFYFLQADDKIQKASLKSGIFYLNGDPVKYRSSEDKQAYIQPAEVPITNIKQVNYLDFQPLGQDFHAVVFIAGKYSPQQLFNQIMKQKQMTSKFFKEALFSDDDNVQFAQTDADAVETITETFNAVCPNTLKRIELPVRSKQCTHYSTCMDLVTYIQTVEESLKFRCYICGKQARFEDLVVDATGWHVMKNYQRSVVQIGKDGVIEIEKGGQEDEELSGWDM
ncbi:MIZ/SP-RING_zinc finger domain-containing protein [Hexamita inflata]|uniref:MIZ/SP-RING zinc finger domain-containing protein n=2 Tax=Hexamita inflata TaxID=28002 RepID=A0AA86P751_9EUKA|nr:MIZ/SP-RING zinc finger domain-containing protein [Hexamita inflata]